MELTDQQLVEQCQRELPYVTTAFETLLLRYEVLVFRTCRRYLHSEQEAEEACQDVFLRAFHGLPRFQKQAAFRTWLFRIVANVCATRYKRLKVQRAARAEYLDAAFHQAAAAEKAHQPAPEDFHEIGGLVGEGLDLLSPNDRQVLILRHISELSFEELAETLETGLSAAKMRLYRAEQRLKAACPGADRQSSS